MNNKLNHILLTLALVAVAPTGAVTATAEDLKGIDPESCFTNTLACNSEAFGIIQPNDLCELTPGFWAKLWRFHGSIGDLVTIDVGSSEFDTFIELFDPDEQFVTDDDDGGPGLDSRIERALDKPGFWTVRVSNRIQYEEGMYDISLACVPDSSSLPAAPSNLTAVAISDTMISIDWQDNSNNEDGFVVEEKEEGESFRELGTVEADSDGELIAGLDPGTAYTYRVRARNAAGDSAYSNQATATTPGPDGCRPTATNLCLLDGRFKLEVEWLNFEDEIGLGRVVELGEFASNDSGLFWFFGSDNWEMLVKMVDACNSPFNSFWVFGSATTNVGFTLTVTDTATGVVREYRNMRGDLPTAIVDTTAFLTCP